MGAMRPPPSAYPATGPGPAIDMKPESAHPEPAVMQSPRRGPVVMSSPPPKRLPGWLIPAVLIVLLGVVAPSSC